MRRPGFALFLAVIAACSNDSPVGNAGDDDDDDGGSQPALTIGIEPWQIGVGEDRLWCRTMKVPGNEGEVYDVNRIRVTMNEGSHHFILYRSSSDLPDDFGECVEMNDRNFITGSQTPGTYETVFPEGKAMPLFAGEQLILETHYANASGAGITGQVDVEMFTIPHDEVDDYLQTALLVYDDFVIPPVSEHTDGDSISEVPGLSIWMMSSHTHKRMTRFVAEEVQGGIPTQIYENTDWHAPKQQVFDPPIVGAQGKQLAWRCTWYNETDHPIYFGPTTEDEMCILVVTFFPALDYAP